MFNTLHTLFQTEYTELSLAIDEIAERIRALGARAPGSYAEFGRLTAIKEGTGTPSATEMIRNLVADQATVIDAARRVVDAAEASRDVATADLGTRRIEIHQKNAWMLRSHLE
jgi:starvation-inducible DNA-binding protein